MERRLEGYFETVLISEASGCTYFIVEFQLLALFLRLFKFFSSLSILFPSEIHD